MINVTSPYLPDFEEYTVYLKGIWERNHLTNNGPLVRELEAKLKGFIGSNHFFYLNNGTIAIQIAIKALELKGEIITTPFSYVATTSSLVWENCKPVFVDIKESDFTIDPSLIEAAITEHTTGILATHVFGIPCDVEAIEAIAKKHNLKVIYDAAHAFGVTWKGKSVLNYGDVSTLSFHATKLYHTVEGGAVVANDDAVAHRLGYMRNFGHNGPEAFFGVGINGKSSEVHAAMGLCLFPKIDAIIADRKRACDLYDSLFRAAGIRIRRPEVGDHVGYNYSYYPVVFEDEEELLTIRDLLNEKDIYPRRYFYPSLNELPYLAYQPTPVSENISRRIACLPLYHGIEASVIEQIESMIVKQMSSIATR